MVPLAWISNKNLALADYFEAFTVVVGRNTIKYIFLKKVCEYDIFFIRRMG